MRNDVVGLRPILSDSVSAAERARQAAHEAALIVADTARQSSQIRLDLGEIVAAVNATLGRHVDRWVPSFALFSSESTILDATDVAPALLDSKHLGSLASPITLRVITFMLDVAANTGLTILGLVVSLQMMGLMAGIHWDFATRASMDCDSPNIPRRVETTV